MGIRLLIKQQKVQGVEMSNEPMTLQAIAQELGMSHQAVSEIITRALKKLTIALEARGLTAEDFYD